LISINNITKEFGGTPLFSGITFNLNDKGCVGLAGMNGSGKTTLLKIMAGEIKSDTGTIAYPNDITIGYLPQEKVITSSKSIREETLEAFKFINKLNERIAELTRAIQQRTDYHSDNYSKLLIELDELNHKLLIYEPDKLLANTEKVLFGLGFKPNKSEARSTIDPAAPSPPLKHDKPVLTIFAVVVKAFKASPDIADSGSPLCD